MPARAEDPKITLHSDVYPGIDINGRLKGAADGKVVYIAGASRGIGAATAHAYALAGCKGLFLTGRSLDTLASVSASIRTSLPGNVGEKLVIETDAVDITDLNAVGESVKRCVQKFGRIDVVIANAGYMEAWTKITECDPIGWWKIWEVNIEYGEQGIKVFSIHPGGIVTELARQEPKVLPFLHDKVELASHTMVRLSSGSEDWLSGRFISCNWDLDELAKRRTEIEEGDLLKNRLDVGVLA
ncbi:hypothetical protein JAAARDRAFT_209947 [Jaapia argillacea MUCL 33604]|uniref:Oxidoreductase n=1 Tax=Jaapia argillacea MUCL 33604 TaxID=933084 RepID=A0A067PFB1_9AGAM|nr:hypothetical protein JAAARDRAFT_209947 [Jaapia argillacea MUCL 33604]